MGKLSQRNLTCDDELYLDAANLSDSRWAQKYKIHPDFKPPYALTVSEDDIRANAREGKSDISHLFQWTISPKLELASHRIFRLGVQIASEEKGHGGKNPSPHILIDCSALTQGKMGACYTEMDTCTIKYSKKFVESLFEHVGRLMFDVRLSEKTLDPLQMMLVSGLEEGFHAESFIIPEVKQQFMIYVEGLSKRQRAKLCIGDSVFEAPVETGSRSGKKKAKIRPSKDLVAHNLMEEYIHDDVVNTANKIAPEYNKAGWESFIATHDRHPYISYGFSKLKTKIFGL